MKSSDQSNVMHTLTNVSRYPQTYKYGETGQRQIGLSPDEWKIFDEVAKMNQHAQEENSRHQTNAIRLVVALATLAATLFFVAWLLR